MQLQTEKRHYTLEQYLESEETAEYKNEYLDGEIIPIAGVTTNHNKICLNFCRNFPLTINTQNYDIYMESVRLWIPDYNFYTYPDIMVIQGQPIYHGRGQSNITNPQIIIEVLSQSTQGYDRFAPLRDRSDKFRYYRSIPIFQEYILISQYNYSVEQYRKQSADTWLISFYEGENATLPLASVDWQISLQDLYQRIDFQLVEE